MISKDLGKMKELNNMAFDEKILPDQCTSALCSYNG